MTYTLAALLGVGIAALLDLVVVRTRLLLRKAFWTAYAIMVFFQLVVNGLLTGLGIVRYRHNQIIGVHIAYAPIEDLFFGFALILLTLTLWVRAGRSSVSRAEPAPRRAGR
ncbi:lycopene cyclase domain-containing protein [uncultured Jatrophihabitans sp.]|uniref:lycopene cyclase domain-containing protein n=1 Tax=uncultured Jatrophihabitans sp. TaxID=1610747 RepID=UPI0035CB2E66